MTPNLQINPQRLWDSLMETAKIGGTPKGGICRLTLTDHDRRVRDWFRAECETLGCTVTVDEVGNMFAVRPGRRADVLPVAMGSHLDTQPTGGKFDGVLGVLGGLEVLRTLNDTGYETNAPLMLVNWTNEEGSRFAPAMLASGVYAGVFDRAFADSRQDRDGVTFGEALEAIGYRGEAKAGSVKFGAMFELHIEQGPILEAEEKAIGVVQGVQGMRWYEVNLTGREAHTGSTPMTLRRNALVGAARLVERVDRIAHAHAPSAVGTVGLMEVKPNSRNVIPGHVFFTVDFRHPNDAVLDEMEKAFFAAVEEVASALKLESDAGKIWESPAVRFDADCIAAVRSATERAGLPARDMVSGAGHDAAYIARVAPTTMIFVPCAGGLSHNEEESTSFDECAAGAQVLLGAVLDYDRRFADGAA
ncbi:M20 family metallo-hydrolase [Chelatococcus sp. SYSU_G07232]|uniref:M20 family metallo-hydrolase n=1 Tax=Chelatococcus albus TaxID=3047466 RepID=A0ABT7AIZ2_9HYPH|nr:M20 family metallo-hydrolase [Chelatococcus sp. SYSU_G07232]MDJ1159348.1 M20 family metallo-hydrolase [Chelatococcus sp. SYSU_G07232]